MKVLLLLIPLSLLMGAGFAAAFLWSVRTRQLEDLDDPAERVLHED
jgi:cbb3-type cytochrome oxidase maturation protein